MGNLARDVLFRMPSCLLLSDKIKGKSALKARTFLHERDKVHGYWFRLSSTENSAGSNILAKCNKPQHEISNSLTF